jgi:hypothetical protein
LFAARRPGVDEFRTKLVSALALLGYPLIGVLALIGANDLDVAGWTSSDGPMPLVALLFVVPVALTVTTVVVSGVRFATSALLVFGTLAASFVLLGVLLANLSRSGALS